MGCVRSPVVYGLIMVTCDSAFHISLGLPLSQFVIDWALALYAKTLPLDITTRIWDLYLLVSPYGASHVLDCHGMSCVVHSQFSASHVIIMWVSCAMYHV